MGATGCTLLLLAALAAPTAAFEEMKEQVVYQLPIGNTGICIRLMNATHQFGCGSSFNGDEGVIVHVQSAEDVKSASEGWKERFPDYTGGFMVLMKETMLDGPTASLLMASSRVSGVLLIPTDGRELARDQPLSGEAACPNRHSSLYSDWKACGSSPSLQWNGKGAMMEQGMRFTDWPKPMTRVLKEKVLETMIKCHDAYNLPADEGREGKDGRVEGRLCAVSMKTFMHGSGSSEQCFRRHEFAFEDLLKQQGKTAVCDQMDDYNLFSVIPPGVANKTSGGGYLAVIARMDGVAPIPDASPATMGTMTALVAALTAAKVLGDNLETFEAASKKSDKRIIFAFLHGESFDYVGSSRWVYDMEHSAFPERRKTAGEEVQELIGLERISLAVELQQIDDGAKLHAHVDGKNYQTDEKKKIDKALVAMAEGMGDVMGDRLDKSRVSDKGVLPPSSLHSILKKRRQTPSILITSFGEQYSNLRLHSTYDRLTGGEKQEQAVKKTIEAAAKGVVRLMADHVGIDQTKRAALKIDSEWLDTLSECLIVSTKFPGCDYLKPFFTSPDAQIDRSTFISAERKSMIRSVVYHLMVLATGEHKSTTNVRSEDACKHLKEKQALYYYEWQVDPKANETYCYRHSMSVTPANSPAFFPNENGAIHVDASSNYSTWTEALMDIKPYQLFLVESRPADCFIFGAGLLMTLLAVLIVGRCDDSSFIVDEGERAAEEGEPL